MKIRIPFTDTVLYIGAKEAAVAKAPVMYGSLSSNIASLIQTGATRVDFTTLYTIYNNVVDVKRAIRQKQSATMREGYKLTSKADPKKEPDATEAKKFNEFLLRGRSLNQLVDGWVRDIEVAGNCFMQIQKTQGGEFLGLAFVDPRTMTIVADQYGNIKKYIQRVAGLDSITFEPEEIVHSVVDFSTRNPMYGVSPIESIVWDARGEMAAQMSNYYFYENNGVPSHLLVFEENIGADQIKDIKASMEDHYKGAKNMFKAGVIPFLKDIKTVALSQKEMQYIQSRQFTTKKVVVAFGVDSFLLGYTEGVQRSNAIEIKRGFYEETIRPLEVYFEQVMNDIVIPRLGLQNVRLEANVSNYVDMDQMSTRTRADVGAGIMTINEARKARGLEDLDNELCDEPLFNGMLIDDLGAEVQQVKDAVIAKMNKEAKRYANLLDDAL